MRQRSGFGHVKAQGSAPGQFDEVSTLHASGPEPAFAARNTPLTAREGGGDERWLTVKPWPEVRRPWRHVAFVGIDDHHRTLHTGSTVLQREVDRSHGSMAAALQGHPMDAFDVRVDDVPTPRIDDRGFMLRKP